MKGEEKAGEEREGWRGEQRAGEENRGLERRREGWRGEDRMRGVNESSAEQPIGQGE